jgi:RND family efflux transporter MFP subunit
MGKQIMSAPSKVVLILCLMLGAYFAGSLANRPPASASSGSSKEPILYWHCPMHPEYKSDRPGDAPCCGMRLEPVYADLPSSRTGALPKGAVEVSAAQQQLIGIHTGEVKRAPASYVLRVPGRITVDEERLYRLIAATDGWIGELGQNSAGTFVKKDQILASYHTLNFQATQQALVFLNPDWSNRAEAAVPSQRQPGALNLQVAIERLRALGMSDLQIDELQRTHRFASHINIYSPVTGFVIARNVSPTQWFDKGTEMYRIADIGHVWVMTDIFEKDREFLKPGAMASVRYQGRTLQARMSDVLPQFDPQSRTLKTRFELDNPGYLLRPDMFVDVEIHVKMPASITVPADAVLASGRRTTVYVQTGDGVFEPRLVETGWRLGDRVQIVHGLHEGERVVVAGNFLLDSESRMKMPAGAGYTLAMSAQETMAAENTAGRAKDPICGMDVDTSTKLKVERDGKTWYFCSEHCKHQFESEGGRR